MSERSSERDADLFSPSLTQSVRRELPAGSRPWRLDSQFYVAFFGGPLAAGAIGVLNGKRLGLSRERLSAIGGIGVAGFVAVAVVAVLLDIGTRGRIVLAVAGVASFLVARELQKGRQPRLRAQPERGPGVRLARRTRPGRCRGAARRCSHVRPPANAGCRSRTCGSKRSSIPTSGSRNASRASARARSSGSRRRGTTSTSPTRAAGTTRSSRYLVSKEARAWKD